MDYGVERRWIYIIHDPAGFIKVGISNRPASRLLQLQDGNARPLRLIVSRRGNHQKEIAIHKALVAFQVRGEWFLDTALPEAKKLVKQKGK